MTHTTTATGPTAQPVQAAAGHRTEDHPTDGRVPGLAARAVAEVAGSFFVILAGLGATMLATETSLQPTVVFGFAVVAAMIAFGHVSGGHFNPAITLGSAVAGRTAWASVAPYLVAQLVGALAAAGLIWLVLSANAQLTGIQAFFSSASNGFGEHSPAQFPLTSAFLLEVVAAALLVAVFLGAQRRRAGRELAPFAVGLTVAALLSFLLPVTNGALNPLRSIASALFAEPWALEQLWLFWAAPLVGGIIAGLVYRSTDALGAPAEELPADREAGDDTAVAAAVPADEAPTARGATHTVVPVEDTPAVRGDAASFFDAPSTDPGETADTDRPDAPDTRTRER